MAIAMFAVTALYFSQPAMLTTGDEKIHALDPAPGQATLEPGAQTQGRGEPITPSPEPLERPQAASSSLVLRRPSTAEELIQVVDRMMVVAGVDPFFGALSIIHGNEPRNAIWAEEVERTGAEAKASMPGLEVSGQCRSSVCAYHVSAAPENKVSKAMRTFGVATVLAADRRGVHMFALYHGPRDAYFLSSDLPAPYLSALGELLGFAFEDSAVGNDR